MLPEREPGRSYQESHLLFFVVVGGGGQWNPDWEKHGDSLQRAPHILLLGVTRFLKPATTV